MVVAFWTFTDVRSEPGRLPGIDSVNALGEKGMRRTHDLDETDSGNSHELLLWLRGA